MGRVILAQAVAFTCLQCSCIVDLPDENNESRPGIVYAENGSLDTINGASSGSGTDHNANLLVSIETPSQQCILYKNHCTTSTMAFHITPTRPGPASNPQIPSAWPRIPQIQISSR